MSTKAIRALAEMFVEAPDEDVSRAARAALGEVEAIERAAKTLSDCSVSYSRGVTSTKNAKAAHHLMHTIARET